MTINLINIGNSQGIRLPKSLLAQIGVSEKTTFEVNIEGGKIVLAPQKHPREGWAEQFQKALAEGEKPETDLFEGVNNKFDEEEWTW